MTDLMDLFDDLDRQTIPESKDTILRAPFGYPGGKSKSLSKILPHLPYRNTYVEPFGGTGAILLGRHPSNLEVLNDRYMGIVAFYRVLRNPKLIQAFVERLDLTLHSREEFVYCRDTWKFVDSDLERAARWYYMMLASFGSMGRNWGRSIKGKGSMAGKIFNHIKHFPELHDRLRKVQIENQDWYDCIIDYDTPETVYYIDPPYIDAHQGSYKHILSHDEHRKLVETIFSIKGFVALSGYSNPLYENQPWDDRHSWEQFVSLQSTVYTEGNAKAHLEGLDKTHNAQEILWIKEAI